MSQVPRDDDTPDSGGTAAEQSAVPVEELVARSETLKGELVDFAQQTRFARQLTARLHATGTAGEALGMKTQTRGGSR